jgi:hypothetical protein
VDGSTVFNLGTLGVSLLALGASGVTARRQIVLQKHANYAPILLGTLSEFRSGKFHRDHAFVCERLPVEHSPQNGISGLPEDVQDRIYSVAYFYQNFSALISLGVMDVRHVMPILRGRLIPLWEAISPFVEAERSASGYPRTHMMTALESLAEQAESFPPDSIITT